LRSVITDLITDLITDQRSPKEDSKILEPPSVWRLQVSLLFNITLF